MPVLKYKDPITGQPKVIAMGPKGEKGEKGDKGDAGANAMGVVVHGATASTARPTDYAQITWIGSVSPSMALTNDIWYNTAS